MSLVDLVLEAKSEALDLSAAMPFADRILVNCGAAPDGWEELFRLIAEYGGEVDQRMGEEWAAYREMLVAATNQMPNAPHDVDGLSSEYLVAGYALGLVVGLKLAGGAR